MILKWIFDRVVALIGLLFLWPVLLVVAIMVKIKMPGGPAFFVQKRVGRNGKLFNCHKFRSMLVAPARNENEDENENKSGWSTVSVAGDSRITPLGTTLRHYKLDELPGLWDVLIGNMSFVGPRPDVPGYADQLQGEDRVVLKLRPGITGPATLKYRLEDEMIADFVRKAREEGNADQKTITEKTAEVTTSACDDEIVSKLTSSSSQPSAARPLGHLACPRTVFNGFDITSAKNSKKQILLPDGYERMTDQELAVWYNDTVIYPDKVRLNKYYYKHYSFIKDIEMIFATVLGRKISFAGERF